MVSIQRKLTLTLVVGASVLLIVAAVSIDLFLRGTLSEEFDENLLSKANMLAGLVERDRNLIEFDFVSRFMPEFVSREPLEFYELRVEKGGLIDKSPSLKNQTLPGTVTVTSEPRFRGVILPNGDPGRLVTFLFKPRLEGISEVHDEVSPDSERSASDNATGDEEKQYYLSREEAAGDPGVSIALAEETEELNQLIVVSRIIVGTAFVLLVGGLALLTWFLVRRNLEPLRRLSRDVEALDEKKLHTRISRTHEVEELEPIQRQLNSLLDRLDRAFQREKRFSGDVAHELKTPIAELRTLSEVGLAWADDREMVAGFFGDLVDLADDMERTVTNLLTLARLDAGTQTIELESVDMSELIENIWKRFADEAHQRHISLDNDVPAGLEVRTDRDKFSLILANIFSNAIAYSAKNTTVTVSASALDGTLKLELSNIAEELAESDLAFMLERFWRKDQSRHGSGHAGLGLSLTKELVQLLNMTIELQLDSESRFTLTLSGMPKPWQDNEPAITA